MNKNQMRQGDVLLMRVDNIPETAIRQKPERGKIILAHGEATGHAHTVDADPLPCPFCGGAAKMFTRTADGTPTHPRLLYWFVCSTYGCGVGVTHGEWTEKAALGKWNKRTP